MSGCARYPIDVDGGLTVTPGCIPQCPIDVDTPEPIFQLPMSVRIIKGCAWRSTLTCNHLANFVIPYVNRIWAQAGINVWLKDCREVQSIPNADPDAPYETEKQFDRRFWTDQQAKINVFVIPETEGSELAYTVMRGADPLNGGAGYTGESFIVMGESLGHSRWGLGHFANTLAHEIGHLLGNFPHAPVSGFLMFDYKPTGHDPAPGEDEKLRPVEIELARANVARGIIPWDFTTS